MLGPSSVYAHLEDSLQKYPSKNEKATHREVVTVSGPYLSSECLSYRDLRYKLVPLIYRFYT